MAKRSLETAIRDLLEPEIAGGLSAFDDVEILLAAWKEMHAERAELVLQNEACGNALVDIQVALREAADKLDVIFRCVYNSRSAPNVLDTIRDIALWARDDAREALNKTEPQPRAEAETALTTAEDGTTRPPVTCSGGAATAQNVAPRRPPSEPEPRPAHEKKAASVAAPSSEAVGHVGSTTGSAPEGGYTQADLDFFADNADEYFAMANAARAEVARLREAIRHVVDDSPGTPAAVKQFLARTVSEGM